MPRSAGWSAGAARRCCAESALPASGLYPIAVTTCTVLAYAAAASLHASGFLAVYLAALVLGNSALPHRAVTRGFVEALAWVAQIGLFVVLGLLVVPIDDFIGAADRAGADHRRGAHVRRPAARRCWSRRCRSACRGESRRSCPGPGCAARCRS